MKEFITGTVVTYLALNLFVFLSALWTFKSTGFAWFAFAELFQRPLHQVALICVCFTVVYAARAL